MRATTAETYDYDAFSNHLLSVASEGGRPNRATTRAISYGDSANAEADGKDVSGSRILRLALLHYSA